MTKPLMILIAGPYRSGTGDDPLLLRRNLDRLEEAAWPIFAAGHLPVIGEWVALPVLASAGAAGLSDPLAEAVMYPTAQRLLQHCDAVLRLPGASTGADADVALAEQLGLPVHTRLEDIPGVGPAEPHESITKAQRRTVAADPTSTDLPVRPGVSLTAAPR
ncbi:MAG: DUF4406 domain-containing protein [Propionibacteriaceae bacterium]